MPKIKESHATDPMRFVMSKLTSAQHRAVDELKEGNVVPWREARKRVEDTIYKLRATYTGVMPQWTTGMIQHYRRIVDCLDCCYRVYSNPPLVKKGKHNGKPRRTA